MKQAMVFGEILESIDRLSPEEQETLMDVVRHRIAERGRRRIGAEIQEVRTEVEEGRYRPTTTEDLMKEMLS